MSAFKPFNMLRTTLLVIAILACSAASAGAATVSATTRYIEGYKGSGDYDTLVTVVAAPGERNVITVDDVRGRITIHDAGAPLTAAAGCALQADGTVACATENQYSLGRVEIHAGDLDDTITSDAGTIDGEAGDDTITADGTLRGGPGNDVLSATRFGATMDGGPGSDRMDGAGAPDSGVIYSARTAPVTVRLGPGGATTTGNGEQGEDDTITGVAHAIGGDGDDVLVGNEQRNYLTGRGGDDRLDGGPGDDVLDGGAAGVVTASGAPGDLPTADIVLGGAGADGLITGPHGRAEGGAGRDGIDVAGAGLAIGGAGPDAVSLNGNGGRVDLADGEADTVSCGWSDARISTVHPARVLLDDRDVPTACRAVRRTSPAHAVITRVDVRPSVKAVVIPAVLVACPEDVRRSCRVALSLTVNGRAAARTVATIPHNGRRYLHLAPSAGAGKALRKASSLPAAITLSTRETAGRMGTLRRTLCLSRAGAVPPQCSA